ncbi:hypothetical protein BDZ97DRAFT_1789403 [Flammula alnicola]|nr:hypothetical protein BDZ97DRAFT_1789403 [Flammula alnicola]
MSTGDQVPCRWKGGCGQLVANTASALDSHLSRDHGVALHTQEAVRCEWGTGCGSKLKRMSMHIRNMHIFVDSMTCKICKEKSPLIQNHAALVQHAAKYHLEIPRPT